VSDQRRRCDRCTLDAQLAYIAGNLDLSFVVGTPAPAMLGVWLVVSNNVIPIIVDVPLPALDQPIAIPVSFPLPSLGTLGVLATLVDAGGLSCSDWATVDTGPLQ
jgi:hypothetical protein